MSYWNPEFSPGLGGHDRKLVIYMHTTKNLSS